MNTNGPGATGTLAATPLAELLIYALSKKLAGSLVFECEDGSKSALSLSNGVVKRSRLGTSQHRLGDVCVELSLVSRADLQQSCEQAQGRLLGEALLERGLDRAELDRALIEQLLRHVQSIAALPGNTVFGYYAEQDFLGRWGTPRPDVDPLTVIWRAARAAPNPRALRVVESLERRPLLRLHQHSRIARFGFSPKEAAVLDVLRAKPQSYAELAKTGLLEADGLARVLYVLAATRHLDVGSPVPPIGVDVEHLVTERHRSSRPSMPAVAVNAARPAAGAAEAAPATSERVREIDQLCAELDTIDHYALLGVVRQADANAVQAAFFQVARKWHPDRLPAELAQKREQVTRIFAKMTEAHRVLSHPQQRAEYDHLSVVADSEEDQAKVQGVLRAATAFQKAEVLARKGDWAGAEQFAAQAYADDPEQAEYGALHAYAVAKSGRRGATREYQDLLDLLDAAVRSLPNNVRVKGYRAYVLKLAGRQNDAIRDYRAIVELEPGNVDAQRELRLSKMNRENVPDEAKSEAPGLFGKLFRKT